MSIYWERCSLCGRYIPVRSCWIHPEQEVCPYCCIACPERIQCSNPVWFKEFKPIVEAAKPAYERTEAVKALEELLKRLEKG